VGLCVCLGGLEIIKLSKTPFIYSVSRLNLGGLGALFGGLSPPKHPRGDGTDDLTIVVQTETVVLFLGTKINFCSAVFIFCSRSTVALGITINTEKYWT